VTVGGRERGKIVISFAGFEDLDRLFRALQGADDRSE
jgi:hypothetical protein